MYAKPKILLGHDDIDLIIAREGTHCGNMTYCCRIRSLGWVNHGNKFYDKGILDVSLPAFSVNNDPHNSVG